MQVVGNSSEICDPTSDFQESYSTCCQCVEVNVEDLKVTAVEYLEPKFRQYRDFCTMESTKPTTPRITYPASMVITTTRVVQMDITQFSGRVDSGVWVTATVTELRQEATTMVTTTSPAEASPTVLPSEIAGPEHTNSSTWIAGPVVSVITAVLLLLAAWWFLRRRRSQKGKLSEATGGSYEVRKYEKGELHADDAPKVPPMELEGSYPTPVPEMGANEVPAQEMLVPEKDRQMVTEMPERYT
ncbi:glycoprotein X [Colletotrichum chrysophilum]|uniref:Glycoprotein X n=1 Tax=Colletotrichum chrysophilum TaxID=1836956 RepID=A0AAD9A115_9PEZI|nr:glycoprotein X [Colletotrichum chrysophilum]